MKNEKFPLTITEAGVPAKIYRGTQTHSGTKYRGFIIAYSLLGKRKQVWRTDLEDAKTVARNACIKIANGEQHSLMLTSADRMIYLRACEALAKLNVPIDVACRDYAEAHAIIAGRVGLVEACRDWIKRHAIEIQRIKLSDAVEQLKEQARNDRKARDRQERIATVLDRFAGDLQVEVHDVSPDLVSRWLSKLPFAERTRRNYSDMIGFFNRFCVRCGFIAKGTDWMDGVQKYRKRKIGTIITYEPSEMEVLLRYAEQKAKDMVPFLAIGAFAGLRHSEIDRLDWKQVDLDDGDGFIEVLPVDGTKSDERRRLVPIKPNLRAWLIRYRKTSGPVCPQKNSTRQLALIAVGAGIAWRRNALRYGFISYRVAECADVPRVADEAGNSVHVIRTNYLCRKKPAQAVEWFGIKPSEKIDV